MGVLSASINNHIRVKSVSPAQNWNPRPSASCAGALTTELRGWDNSTRNNYKTCIAFGVTPECPACGKHRDVTGRSFPTEGGDLLGKSQALMHISHVGCVTMMVFLKSDETRTEFKNQGLYREFFFPQHLKMT